MWGLFAGFTQADVGAALGKLYGSEFSQTTVSRFEALRLTFNNMVRLQPLLETWLSHVVKLQQRGFVKKVDSESGVVALVPSGQSGTAGAHDTSALGCELATSTTTGSVASGGGEGGEANGSGSDADTVSELIDLPGPNRKRKRKRRTTIDGELRMQLEKHYLIDPKPAPNSLLWISAQLNVDKEVVRVWFCNRRQRDRRLVDQEPIGLTPDAPELDADGSDWFGSFSHIDLIFVIL